MIFKTIISLHTSRKYACYSMCLLIPGYFMCQMTNTKPDRLRHDTARMLIWAKCQHNKRQIIKKITKRKHLPELNKAPLRCMGTSSQLKTLPCKEVRFLHIIILWHRLLQMAEWMYCHCGKCRGGLKKTNWKQETQQLYLIDVNLLQRLNLVIRNLLFINIKKKKKDTEDKVNINDFYN